MDSKFLPAHVLSARHGQYDGHGCADAWIFGVVLDEAVEGHVRWIIETADPAVISDLQSAYGSQASVNIRRELLVDPAINAVD